MKNKIGVFLLILCILLIPIYASGAAKVRAYTSLTGGGSGALDSTSVADLEEGDAARVSTISGTTVTRYDYIFDADGTDVESSPTIIRPDDYSTGGVWRLAKIYNSMLDSDLMDLASGITGIPKGAGDGGGFSAAVSNTDYAAATHASRHNAGGADPIDRFTEGITEVETTSADATPDVTNGGTVVVRLLESNANGTITDFDDGDDHSEFVAGDWFVFRITDASTVIDFSDNANIEGNANTDFTGSATQIVDLLFMWDGSAWQCLNLFIGMSDPTTLDIDTIVTTETEFIPVAYMIDGSSAPAALATLTSTNSVDARAFDGASNEDLKFVWVVPEDIDQTSGIKFSVICYVGSATAPANTEVVAFSLAGVSFGNSDAMSGAVGTAQTSSLTADASYVQYDKLETAFSSAITVTNLADGETVHFNLIRLATTTDTYAQDIHVAGIKIKYKREHNATF